MKTLFTHRIYLIFSIILLTTVARAQDSLDIVHIGTIYPLSTHGYDAKKYSNVFSLHAVAGVSREERAFAISGVALIVKENANGFKASGVAHVIGGNARGFTASGVAAIVGGKASGFTSSGMANIVEGNVSGFTSSGFINIYKSGSGFQSAGFINLAKDSISGFQAAGYLNIAKNVHGVQAAVVNKAGHVRGTQIGVVNIAESNKYPIGIINLIKDGEKSIGISTDDNLSTMITFRSGSEKLYGVLGVGGNFNNEKEIVAVQVGIGAHLITTDRFRLNTELTTTMLNSYKKEEGIYRGDFNKYALSILPALQLGKLELFAGPSLNVISTDSYEGQKLVDHYIWDHTTHNNNLVGFYIGYVAGANVRF